MVVCRYFLQGTCKFGDRCRYDHQLNDNYHYSNYNTQQHTSILRQSNFGGPQQTASVAPQVKPVGSVDIGVLLKSVVTDVEAVDKGGQWLLSCYAPFKDKPAIAGFEDFSFEEVRFGYLEAQRNNTLTQYVQYIQSLMQNAIVKFKALQSPNEEVVRMLTAINSTPPSTQAGVFANNIFAGNQPTPFGQSNTAVFGQGPVFGTSQPQTNIFTQASSNVSATSIFGGQNTSPANQPSVTSTTFPQGSTFGNVGVSPNTNPPMNSPLFAGNNAVLQQQNAVFQQQTSPFQTQQNTQNQGFSQSTNLFAPQNVQQQQPLTNMFANAQSNSPMFSSHSSNSPFSQTNTQQVLSQPNVFVQNSNVFNQAANSNMSVGSNSGSIFGSNQTTQIGNSQADPRVYSKREDLTADDVKWFESEDCDITAVPEKPPSYDMCFGR